MPPVKMRIRPPACGWRGLNPTVVVQVAQLLRAARLIEDGNTRIGRELLAAWAAVDPERPDTTAYVRIVAELACLIHENSSILASGRSSGDRTRQSVALLIARK